MVSARSAPVWLPLRRPQRPLSAMVMESFQGGRTLRNLYPSIGEPSEDVPPPLRSFCPYHLPGDLMHSFGSLSARAHITRRAPHHPQLPFQAPRDTASTTRSLLHAPLPETPRSYTPTYHALLMPYPLRVVIRGRWCENVCGRHGAGRHTPAIKPGELVYK